ncbi:MAG: hypothetical protein HFI39_10010 [Lachnospiraceae bacterium]|nr:hypothetical protein [Lachnospiraceae bacterium]
MKKEMREACFVCTTPYQVIGAISIVNAYKIDADIYILGMFDAYREVAKMLRKYKIFLGIYDIDSAKFRAQDKTVKAFSIASMQMLFAERTLAYFLPSQICYNKMYTSSRAHVKVLFQHVMQKRNPSMNIVLYDDGVGSYLKDSHIFKVSHLRKRLEKLLRWKLFMPEKTSLLLYCPELAERPCEFEKCEWAVMPRIKWDRDSREMLCRVFGVDQQKTITEKCILFDELRGVEKVADKKSELLDQCFLVLDEYMHGNIICKSHPRSLKETQTGITLYPNSSAPAEVLYAVMPDLEEKILVSYCSTALFTPKIMFGKEPAVIMLHRIIDGSSNTTGERLYQKLHSIYNKKSRVIAPNNLEQLRNYLNGKR